MKKTKKPLIWLLPLLIIAAGCRTVEPPVSKEVMWTPPDPAGTPGPGRPCPVIAVSTPLTLADLVDLALENNPETSRAWRNAQAAADDAAAARSRWYPSLKVTGTAEWDRADYHPETELEPDTEALRYGPGLELTYLVLDFGGRSGTVEETTQNLLAANFEFNRVFQDLLLRVEEAYYTLIGSQAFLEAAGADVEETKTALRAAELKFEAGLSSRLDVLQARTRHQEALYSRAESGREEMASRAELTRVLGMPADTHYTVSRPEGSDVPEIPEAEISRLIDTALASRPDIAAQRARAGAERETLVGAELAASAEVWTRYYDYRAAREKLAFGRSLRESAAAAYDLALKGYKEGLKSIIDLLQAQAALSRARSRLIGAREDLFLAVSRLAHATGSIGTQNDSAETAGPSPPPAESNR